jgi:arylsulfatase A-like enzyme
LDRDQIAHVIDIVPTILEATKIKVPTVVNGIPQKPIEGTSLVYTFDKANADAPTRHTTQYFEMRGYRGIYHDGWHANTEVPFSPWSPVIGVKMLDPQDYKWELYKLADDGTQYNSVAANTQEAWKNNVSDHRGDRSLSIFTGPSSRMLQTGTFQLRCPSCNRDI